MLITPERYEEGGSRWGRGRHCWNSLERGGYLLTVHQAARPLALHTSTATLFALSLADQRGPQLHADKGLVRRAPKSSGEIWIRAATRPAGKGPSRRGVCLLGSRPPRAPCDTSSSEEKCTTRIRCHSSRGSRAETWLEAHELYQCSKPKHNTHSDVKPHHDHTFQ